MISSEPYSQNNRPSLYFRALSGHRANYVRILGCYFDHILEDRNLSVLNRLDKLIRPSRLVFGMVDDGYLQFFLVSMLRLFLFKDTAGFFVRPQTCFNNTVISKVKFFMFWLLCKIPKIHIYSLMPHNLYPELEYVCNDFIYDPELWHLHGKSDISIADQDFSLPDLNSGEGPTILLCGSIATHKGIKDLREILCNGHLLDIGYRVIIAGKTPEHEPSKIIRCELESLGCISIDRYISDSELDYLYEIADYIWCSYDHQYDQASGIFGTAIQKGKMPIVRAGSLISRFAACFSIPTVELSVGNPQEDIQRILQGEPAVGGGLSKLVIDQWRLDFESKLEVHPH